MRTPPQDPYNDLAGDPTLDPRHFRFARSSGLPRDYFGRRRTWRIRPGPWVLAALVGILFLGFWATSASVSDEEIRVTPTAHRAPR
jgi:hypothetical protein